MAPLICYNEINHYRCACPQDQPNCELLPWMVALIAVLVVVAVVALIVFAVVRYKIKKRYSRIYFIIHSKPLIDEGSIAFVVIGLLIVR